MLVKVNRHLADTQMDNIDHALGRPVNPMGETYREYFAACATEAHKFRASEFWKEGKSHSDLVWFYVTQAGRKALADYLKEIGDKNRHYVVTWGEYEMNTVAESHGKARYKKWIEISDAIDISFAEFQKTARVRLAA